MVVRYPRLMQNYQQFIGECQGPNSGEKLITQFQNDYFSINFTTRITTMLMNTCSLCQSGHLLAASIPAHVTRTTASYELMNIDMKRPLILQRHI